MRKKRQEQRQNESNSRLEQIVREVMQRHAEEQAFNAGKQPHQLESRTKQFSSFIPGITTKALKHQTVIGFPKDKIYNRSYQEAMDRPISIISYDASDFQDITSENRKNNRYSTLINGNSDEGETVKEESKGKLLQNMSSGLGTTAGSKEEEKTESMEMKNMPAGASQDTEHDEESALCPDAKKEKREKQSSQETTEECKQPWLTLASYVDELTVGGRRNSKGQFIDGMGSFPGFGRNKPDKLPPDCFPAHCYQR